MPGSRAVNALFRELFPSHPPPLKYTQMSFSIDKITMGWASYAPANLSILSEGFQVFQNPRWHYWVYCLSWSQNQVTPTGNTGNSSFLWFISNPNCYTGPSSQLNAWRHDQPAGLSLPAALIDIWFSSSILTCCYSIWPACSSGLLQTEPASATLITGWPPPVPLVPSLYSLSISFAQND